MGVLTNADVMSFAGYCQAVSDVRRLTTFVRENGTNCLEVKMLENAWARLRAFASDFGMNPSARTRITLPGKKADTLDDLLG